MGGLMSFSFKDYSKELSTVRFALATITAANFDTIHTSMVAFQAALIALQVEDALQSRRYVAENLFVARAPAASALSQRENKWLLTAEDTTLHSIFRHEVPLANSALLADNSDQLKLTAGPGSAFKSAFEALVRSPAGNEAALLNAEYVGKRL